MTAIVIVVGIAVILDWSSIICTTCCLLLCWHSWFGSSSLLVSGWIIAACCSRSGTIELLLLSWIQSVVFLHVITLVKTLIDNFLLPPIARIAPHAIIIPATAITVIGIKWIGAIAAIATVGRSTIRTGSRSRSPWYTGPSSRIGSSWRLIQRMINLNGSNVLLRLQWHGCG